jgi:catechol-2,3-dioxygenase
MTLRRETLAIDVRGVCRLLQVFDMQRSVTFYCDVFGFEVKSSSPGEQWAFLERENSALMLNAAYEPDSRPAAPDAARIAAQRTRTRDSSSAVWTSRAHMCSCVCAGSTWRRYDCSQMA